MIFLGVQSEILYLHSFKRYKLLKKSLRTRADRQLDTSTLFLLPPLPPLVAAAPARSSILVYDNRREWGNIGELKEVGVRIRHLDFSSAPSPRAPDFFNRSSCKISLLPRRSLFSDRVTIDDFAKFSDFRFLNIFWIYRFWLLKILSPQKISVLYKKILELTNNFYALFNMFFLPYFLIYCYPNKKRKSQNISSSKTNFKKM